MLEKNLSVDAGSLSSLTRPENFQAPAFATTAFRHTPERPIRSHDI
jgi:hypothetical protein